MAGLSTRLDGGRIVGLTEGFFWMVARLFDAAVHEDLLRESRFLSGLSVSVLVHESIPNF
jgi:hypothetical protein